MAASDYIRVAEDSEFEGNPKVETDIEAESEIEAANGDIHYRPPPSLLLLASRSSSQRWANRIIWIFAFFLTFVAGAFAVIGLLFSAPPDGLSGALVGISSDAPGGGESQFSAVSNAVWHLRRVFTSSDNSVEEFENSPAILFLSPLHLRQPLRIHGRNLPVINNPNWATINVGPHSCKYVRSSSEFIECEFDWPSVRREQNLFWSGPVTNIVNISDPSQTTNLPEFADYIVSVNYTEVLNSTIKNSKSNFFLSSRPLPFHRIISHWERNNIALVIMFNWVAPVGERLPLLYEEYGKLFPWIITTATSHVPGVNIVCPGNDKGHVAYTCLSEATKYFPGFTGYLFNHFDCLPHLKKMERFNVSKIWQIRQWWVGNKNDYRSQNWPPPGNGWHWAHEGQLLQRIQDEMVDLADNQKNASYQRWVENYKRNLGWDVWQSGPTDVHYLPGRLANDWQILGGPLGIIDRQRLFLEAAFQFLTGVLLSNMADELIILDGHWLWYGDGAAEARFWAIPDTMDFFHPVHLHTDMGRKMLQEQVRRAIPAI